VLKELGIPITLSAPEPNTWRELLRTLDDNKTKVPLKSCRVAVQEYGESNSDMLAGLAQRGAIVTTVPVYDWALPEDTGPLRSAATAISKGELDVALFTTSVQVKHLFQIAAEMGLEEPVRAGLSRMLIASIGPVTSERIKEAGLQVDLEPSHPKMGILVGEAAQQSAQLLRSKRHPVG
jgi:uroporphyrinogen-III synthase